MKKISLIKYLLITLVIFGCKNSPAQNPQNWTSKQLTEPSDLAVVLKEDKDVPVIFSVGPGAVIPNSIDIGMVKDAENLAKFKEQVSKLPRESNILIYCGCCPFERCPNVRPAISVLQNLKFTNYHLLDLPHNIKTDWIDKGYPTSE